MKAYRVSVNLKLGLILFAVLIAVSSLWYAKDLSDRLRHQETAIIQLWARVTEQIFSQERLGNPYQESLLELEAYLTPDGPILGSQISASQMDRYLEAIQWAQTMPPASDLNFILSTFLEENTFEIPAILEDRSVGRATMWRNVPIEVESIAELDSLQQADPGRYERIRARLASLEDEMDAVHEPIPIEVEFPAGSLRQSMHYGESSLVRAIRWFPYIQLGFVGLFVFVGYIGFSYVRSSEQKSLWVGMAKEAAHQLGTPISSLMGWVEVLRLGGDDRVAREEAFSEIENDIQRLTRVTSRFSDIGSLPKLEVQKLAPIIGNTSEYIRRRLPRSGKQVVLSVDVPEDLEAPVNAELFEWVIENLLKNALDAMQGEAGSIQVLTRVENRRAVIDVTDTGRGIDRRNWKNVFRPGYSTKKRGWGLGLSLARRIVEDYHGGSLDLTQSRPGEGTTFRISLPMTHR